MGYLLGVAAAMVGTSYAAVPLYTAAPFNAARSAPSPRLLPLTRFTYASRFFVGVLELRICGDHCYAVLDLVDTGSTSPIIG
jgi:hypothetical protein